MGRTCEKMVGSIFILLPILHDRSCRKFIFVLLTEALLL
jgi:hypothetical protein